MKELLFQLFEVTLAFYGSPVNAHQASGSELLSTITQLDTKKKLAVSLYFVTQLESSNGLISRLLSCTSTTVSCHCSDLLVLLVLCFLLRCSLSSTACCMFPTPADREFSFPSFPLTPTGLARTLSTMRSFDTHPPNPHCTQLSSEHLASSCHSSAPCTSCASSAPHLPQQ